MKMIDFIKIILPDIFAFHEEKMILEINDEAYIFNGNANLIGKNLNDGSDYFIIIDYPIHDGQNCNIYLIDKRSMDGTCILAYHIFYGTIIHIYKWEYEFNIIDDKDPFSIKASATVRASSYASQLSSLDDGLIDAILLAIDGLNLSWGGKKLIDKRETK